MKGLTIGIGAVRRASLLFALGLGAGVLAPQAAQAAPDGPCDIAANARIPTPCVAAHSTTRVLLRSYAGPLYQVYNEKTKGTLKIYPFANDGIANTAPQDSFCAGAVCRIVRIYDQAKHMNINEDGNDLTPGRAGDKLKTPDKGAIANALPIKLKGHRVYGIQTDPGIGYRDIGATATTDGRTRDTARDDNRNKIFETETVLMVTSALHTNTECCFNYGNAERKITDAGGGHMNAVYMGSTCPPKNTRKICLGTGPWVQADLEDGVFMSDNWGNDKISYRGDSAPFVTALLKDLTTEWTLKSGDATRSALIKNYKGAWPITNPGTANEVNYRGRYKEGGIVLGLGGDNSAGGSGRFYEGFMTKPATASETDDLIQINIAALNYGS